MAGFHEVRFPLQYSAASVGGPERRTEIVTLASGAEERNQIWAHSRRKYNVGAAVRTTADIETVLAFFEERRGRLYGFRWRDLFDRKSCALSAEPSALDQAIGTGNGTQTAFQLVKRSGSSFAPYSRTITKPVSGTVKVAVAGTELTAGVGFTVATTTGIVTLTSAPTSGQAVTAGFEFDVPVRFDTDVIEVDWAAFRAGQVPNIPIIEIRV